MMSLTALLFYDASTPSCASGITSGVKLINLPEKEKVASVAKVRTASAEIDGEEVEIKEEDDSPENTSEIIVDNSEDNVSDDVENK